MSRKSQTDLLGNDELWVDYLESGFDVESSLKTDLSRLLMNSLADRKRFAQLKKIRELLKKGDDVPLPENGKVYEDLHDRIMAAVDGKKPKKAACPATRVSPKRQLRFSAIFSTSLLFMLVAGLVWISVERQEQIAQNQAYQQTTPKRTRIVKIKRVKQLAKAVHVAKAKSGSQLMPN